jgi:hypothetical protein
MKRYIKLLIVLALLLPTVSSCLEEEFPTNGMTQSQVDGSAGAMEALNTAVAAQMLNMGSTYGACGFAGQMVELDAMTGQIPVARTGYDYFSYYCSGDYMGPTYAYCYDTWKLYYDIVNKANLVIAAGNDVHASTEQGAEYVGNALAYRALAYFNMAQLYEYQTTSFSSLDAQAKADSVYGLTVPIVDESTTQQESYNNPRVPFYTMYRFILSDLNRADTLLTGYTRDAINQANLSVVYGLKARFWLTLGTRFDNSADDLSTQLAHESDAALARYDRLGVTTAKACFEQAIKYAQLARQGYSPMSQSDWYSGFNAANQAWMFAVQIGSDDMSADTNWSWKSFVSFLSNETSFGIGGSVYGASRMIDKALYDEINTADWRRKTWIDPSDAGQADSASKYVTLLKPAVFAKTPAYAGLKFKPGDNEMESYQTGAAVDIPLMRVEEMYFIEAEAEGHVNGLAAGKKLLEDFMNTYRCTKTADSPTPYTCSATTLWTFTTELIRQKRVEFWGEGLIYFDYKRLKMGYRLKYDGSNHPSNYQYNFANGYVAPVMNLCITNSELQYNSAIRNNPDPSGVEAAANK